MLGRRRLGHRSPYIVYGPLMNGVTSVMYEGAPDYPAKDIWWELCERHGVTVFYTAPTAIRACIKWGVEHPQKHDLSSLRLLGTVGEPINPKAWLWYWKVIGGERCPIVDTWWQTETGHIMISLPGVTAAKPGSATRPLPGIEPVVLDEAGNEVECEQGLLAIKRPWPGMLRTLFKDRERFKRDLLLEVRRDDLLRRRRRPPRRGRLLLDRRSGGRRGQRLGPSALHGGGRVGDRLAPEGGRGGRDRPADEASGQAICAFVILEGELEGGDRLEAEVREHVALRIGKFARPKRIIWTADVPKTRSGKIMRLLRDIADGRELGDVTTLREPGVMKDLEAKFGDEDGSE